MTYAILYKSDLKIAKGKASEEAERTKTLYHPYLVGMKVGRYPDFEGVMMFFEDNDCKAYMEYKLYEALQRLYARWASEMGYRKKAIEMEQGRKGKDAKGKFKKKIEIDESKLGGFKEALK